MTFLAARIRRLFLGTLLSAWASTAECQVEPLNVCAFGFHSHEELAAVRAELPADAFDFIDFSAELLVAETAPWEVAGTSANTGRNPADHDLSLLLGLCASDLRCDISVYSGEFAGEFFGRYGSSLSLQTLEEAACQPRCQGLFQRSQEVFLLACKAGTYLKSGG